MQKWRKLGLVFSVNQNYEWMQTHSTCPFAYHLQRNLFRVFFSTRDTLGFSHGAWLDIDITKPHNIINVSSNPLISPDEPGYFGDAGVVPFQIIKNNNKYLMYYSGWTLKNITPFDFYIGLASSEDLCNFEKFSTVPILDRTPDEPFLIGAPYVINDNGLYKMWYISGDKWVCKSNNYRHYYSIKYAESKDGISWNKRGIKCISYDNEFEFAFARPVVIKEKDTFKMWYTYRGQSEIDKYRAGYAESCDGVNWIRKDENVGIGVSDSGWDSEMICYPYVFEHKGKRYMLYNGNDYGKTGFGLAVLESE